MHYYFIFGILLFGSTMYLLRLCPDLFHVRKVTIEPVLHFYPRLFRKASQNPARLRLRVWGTVL